MTLLAQRVISSSHQFVLFPIQVLIYPEAIVKNILAGGENNNIFKGDTGQSLAWMATRKIGISIV